MQEVRPRGGRDPSTQRPATAASARLPSGAGRGALARAAIAALTAGWIALLFWTFRPGLMSVDSVVHYAEGLARSYSNQHPPLVAVIFGISGRIAGTPAGILALQLALVGGGFALLARRAARAHPQAALLLTGAFLAAPSTWAIAIALWKDVLLAGALLLACAALRAARTRTVLALAVLAALLRHNAIFATVPLAAGALWTSASVRSGRARAALLVAVVAASALASAAVERATRARDVWPVGQLFAYDLAGIYLRHPEALATSALARDVSVDELRRLYTPWTGGPLLFPAGPEAPGIPFHGLAARRELAGEWVRAIRAHPAAYLAHRFEVFRSLLGARGAPAFAPYQTRFDPNPWGYQVDPERPAYATLTRLRDAARESFVLRGWFWVTLATLATALAAARVRRDAVPFWIAASGLAYALAYAGISVASELRYLYWTVLSPFAALAAALGPADDAGAPPLRSTPHCESPPTIRT